MWQCTESKIELRISQAHLKTRLGVYNKVVVNTRLDDNYSVKILIVNVVDFLYNV
jgi:hypothetical protein